MQQGKVRVGRRETRLAVLLAFLRSEAAGGTALIVAAAAALVWSNCGAAPLYRRLTGLPIQLQGVSFSLHGAVNDGLMTLFFLLVSLEIRHEMSDGMLSAPGRLAAPMFAACGGVVMPALIYFGFNHGDASAMRGWAVPVATDIAFSLAVIGVLGRRVPTALKLFLAALAIIDDLLAILVIALFYSDALAFAWMAGAALVWLALLALGRLGVGALWPYLVGGALLWLLVERAGLHPTLAGVALAFAVPSRPRRASATRPPGASATQAPSASPTRPQGASATRRLERGLQWWVAFLVLPLFGVFNAGLDLSSLQASDLSDPVTLGIGLGLLLGKPIGVFGAVFVAVRIGAASLPDELDWPQVGGAALLCGIGFTMSLFIGDLAFPAGGRESEVKLAVFGASTLAALIGVAVLAALSRRRPAHAA